MVGDEIAFDGLEGTIEAIDNNSVTLSTKKGKIVVPIKDMVSKRVTFKKQEKPLK